MNFERIILSTDENPTYYQFWILVADSWKKFFPSIPISLAFITDREEDDLVVKRMREKGDVYLFRPVPGIPTGNLAKVSRFLMASQHKNEICLCFDMDSIPLNSSYLEKLIAQRKHHYLLAVGAEVYYNTPHSGKFPSGYFTGEGYLFGELFNPNSLPYEILVREFIDFRVFDHKEAINNSPDVFSDESLIRALIKTRNIESKVQHVCRGENPDITWIDRACWRVNEKWMESGGYSCCNMLRPFEPNYDRIKPVIRYIYGRDVSKEEIIFRLQ